MYSSWEVGEEKEMYDRVYVLVALAAARSAIATAQA